MTKPKGKKQKDDDTNENEITNNEIYKKLQQMDANENEVTNKEIYKKLQQMEKSIEYMSTKFEEIQEENKEIKKMLKEQEKENIQLKSRLEAMEKVIDNIEKEKIENNIVITGVTRQGENENTKEVVQRIIKKLNSSDLDIDVVKCYRKQKNENDNNITVELKTKEQKQRVLKARKEIGTINSIDCELKGKNNKIYINEQLTTEANRLFYKARQLKKEHKVKYVWTREGKVYVKKEDTSDKIKINNEADLTRI